MAKNKRLSKDQQRKAKLAKRHAPAPIAINPLWRTPARIQKTDEYVPIVFRTELKFHEADVMSDKKLTDAPGPRRPGKARPGDLAADTLRPGDQGRRHTRGRPGRGLRRLEHSPQLDTAG